MWRNGGPLVKFAVGLFNFGADLEMQVHNAAGCLPLDAAITRRGIVRYASGGAAQPAVYIVVGVLHGVCGDHALRI